MKVVHLVAGELSGGAARGAYWLHKALRDLEVESSIITTAKDTLGDKSVNSLTDSVLAKLKLLVLYKIGRMLLTAYRDRQPMIFSTGIDGLDFTRHPTYISADVVHLHWVSGLVSTRMLRKIKKPVIWTLRDMWPFTGGCHYSMECERYAEGCGKCPQLGSAREKDLSRFIIRRKQASVPEHMRLVGISRWMSDCASKSAVFRKCQVATISNNIDTRLFLPLPKKQAKQVLGLDVDQKIVLVGARRMASVPKGFDLFLEAVGSMTKANIHVVLFGNAREGVLDTLGVPTTNLGFLADATSLRLAYSAADVFVLPSRVDAFGKTLAEAMSCGTPVVCFNATGPKDIVEHRLNGYMAEPFSPVDLAHGIQWVLDQPSEKYAELCRSARMRAEVCFDSQVIAKEYLALYRDTLRSTEP
jgi:glycosyltransferase involved in cell wall biosynthesis